MVCVPECPGARTCERRASCPYARMFEPSGRASGPSGLEDWPRPFVFRASHLSNATIAPGASFFFDLHWFDMRNPAIGSLVLAFAELAREGMGPRRGRAELAAVWQLNETGEPAAQLFEGTSMLQRDVEAMQLSLRPEPAPVGRVRVRFVTPTELKAGQQVVDRPEFGVLASRVRDRVSTLRSLYDDGPLAIDFREFGERASHVRLTHCDLRRVDATRRSTRTGQVHSIGGFVGEAEYEGELAEFVPYLKVAKWTGVGRQTVWGKGELLVIVCRDTPSLSRSRIA